MSSPALNEKFMSKLSSFAGDDTSKMTIHGTINKTGILLMLTVLGALIGWNVQSPILLIGGLVVGLVCSLLIIFGPQRAPSLSPVYALSEGLLLGSISATYSFMYPGIVSNALLLTLSVLGIMLGLYRFRIIRVTEKTRSVIMAATLAIALTYLIEMVMSMFGSGIPMIHQSGTYGIAFSVIVVGVAAFNLLLDFDMIEQAQMRGAPKFMEWYGGFALLLTLIWLYLEILRLLSKMNKK